MQMNSDAAEADAWPITGATFALIDAEPQNIAKTRAVLSFFDWSWTQGEGLEWDLDYVPLPARLRELAITAWKSVHDREGRPAWP
jgi:phosphate transport system substrate-binding protein